MGVVVRNGHTRGLGLLTCEVTGGSALVVGGNMSVEGGKVLVRAKWVQWFGNGSIVSVGCITKGSGVYLPCELIGGAL